MLKSLSRDQSGVFGKEKAVQGARWRERIELGV